jgi:DNA/RNA endonuclease G (NUC1)
MNRTRQRTLRNVLLALFLGLTGAVQVESKCCRCDVRDRVPDFDALLWLSDTAKSNAAAAHCPWGIPKPQYDPSGEHLLFQNDYIIYYDDDLLVPLWVGYRLKGADTTIQRKRTECFRVDPRLSSIAAATCHDYLAPFDCGHLAPNADFKQSEAAMVNTYIMSNMAPQYGNFNQRIWSWLEDYVRKWAQAEGSIYVITGSVFDRDGNSRRDADEAALRLNQRVAIPTHFYKIIVRKRASGGLNAIAILLPNDDEKRDRKDAEEYLKRHLASIRRLEQLTGLDFFPKLSDTAQNTLEKPKARKLWSVTENN